jgi:hypothetical protein
LLIACALAAGCSDDPTIPGNPPVPRPIQWNQLRGGLGVGEIRSIGGLSARDLLAVHATGIIHYDGDAWRAESIPASIDTLYAVWSASPQVAFASGGSGVILRRDAGAWSATATPTTLDIRDIHGTSATDVYAVASTRLYPDTVELLHDDGSGWNRMDTRDGVDANAVFAVTDGAFVACNAGIALRWDGTTLHDDPTFVTENLFDMWAASAADAYAVGERGRILHWDGAAWTPMAGGVSDHLRAVAGNSAGDIIAAGDHGVMLHSDGVAWTRVSSGTVNRLSSARLFPGGEGFVGGSYGTLVVGGGAGWAPRNQGLPLAFEAVWATGGYYIAVGGNADGGQAHDRYGFAWSFPEGMHAISASTPEYVFAGGDGGAIYRFAGRWWQKQDSPASSALRGMTALVTRFGDPFRVYAAGDDGTLLVWKSGVWTLAAPPAGAENHQFVDIWAAATDDVFAVACNATSLVRYDDPYEVAGWSLEQTPATAPLLAVGGLRGDVYIASEAGEIFFNDGNGWQSMPTPVTTPIRDIRAISERSLFAVGEAGVILHFDGAVWKETASKFAGDLMAIWGSEDSSVFAVGKDGAVLLLRN